MADIGSKGVEMAIGIMLILLVGAAVIPPAINDWFNATTGSWGSGAAAIWPVIPLIALVALLYFLYRRAA